VQRSSVAEKVRRRAAGAARQLAPILRQSLLGRDRVDRVLRLSLEDSLASRITSPMQTAGMKPPWRINWVVPVVEPGGGGIGNIQRFARLLGAAGHETQLTVYNAEGRFSTEHALRAIAEGAGPGIPVNVLADSLPDADVHFATSWQTAYAVAARETSGRRLYWVQDYEPWFYAAGSEQELARATYSLGLSGVVLGHWLAEHLRQAFGMTCHSYDFGAEGFQGERVAGARPEAVCFYARPETPRRGFELGVLTLRELHRRRPEVKIHLFGGDLERWHLPFPATRHGVLAKSDLQSLYQECRAGLVLSFTNASLAPLEMLAAGCRPVLNDAEHVRAVLHSPDLVWAAPDVAGLADALVGALDAAQPEAVELPTWSTSVAQVEQALRIEMHATGP
jgi:glycosyltransferase involved in cell wall biosynthesis